MPSERIAIYAGTRNIYHDMTVSAKSLLFHHGADRIIFLIEDDTFPEQLPSCISIVNVSSQSFFPASGPNYHCNWTYMVMMRVALTKLFPDLNRALVLDHDTIIHKPIDYLWTVDLADNYYALVEEKQIESRTRPYFNFGVAVHNLALLRKDKADDTIINSVNTVRFAYCEQDAINSVCRNRILALPPEYNVMSFNKPPVPDENVIIRHYAARKYPLSHYDDYKYYDAIPWSEIAGNTPQKKNGSDTIRTPLHTTAMIPAYGMKRYDIINYFIRTRNYYSFLEIGTDKGEAFDHVTAPIRVSVDPDPSTPAAFHMTSDEFFSTYTKHFDIIFIDGLHECHQAYRDITNALSHLNPSGVIVVHDCLPTTEQMQIHADKYPGGEWTGDVWKAFLKSRSELPYLTYTIDTDYGCGIIDTHIRIKNKPSGLRTDMGTMTYNEFVNNKTHWMNIKGGIIHAEE